jgi:molybdate/tungstate transport system substrate-binding protein
MRAPLYCLVYLTIVAAPVAVAAESTVNVLYAGSLVNLMEHSVGPAYTKASGDQFRGYSGGSNKVANEIKGELRRGDVFISANPKVNDQLMGAANGDWVRWYILFAESPLVIGYNPASRFAADFKNKPWYEVLSQPGIKIGRTDPKLDPKGAFTVELLLRAEEFYKQPGLSQKILGASDNPAQVLPEEVLVGRFQSGELDVGFFYTTEAADAKIQFVRPPAEIEPKARYTAAILRDAPNPASAQRFVVFLLGPEGRRLLQQHGINLVNPTLGGDAQTLPASIKSLINKPK